MTKQTWYIAAACILFGLLPLVPRMVALRTRVLYALHLRCLAGWHERNTGALIVVVRVSFVVIALFLAILAYASGR